MSHAATQQKACTGITHKRHPAVVFLLIVIFVTGLAYLFRPLFDPDFYWHLHTGKWIWQNRSLPHTDLFGLPPAPSPSVRTEFIYTSYWLIQLILHGFYALLGIAGIILFRWLAAGVSLATLACWTNLRSAPVLAVVATGSIQLLEFYFIERPQFMSFIFFGIILLLYLKYLHELPTESKVIFCTAPVMLLWSNIHGGFVIGQALILFFMLVEGMKFLNSKLRPVTGDKYKKLLIASLVALAFSFINPNYLNSILYFPHIFDSSHYINVTNIEELSLFAYYRSYPHPLVFLYALSMILTLLAFVLSDRKTDITWFGLIAGTSLMGFLHMRLMPFFLVAATLFMTKYFESARPVLLKKTLLYSSLVLTMAACLPDEITRAAETLRSGLIPPYQYPVQAADFLRSNRITGNTYTTMYWGGFLGWRTEGANRIFYDSRTLDFQRAMEYDKIRTVIPGMRPFWKGMFDRYDVRIAVVPFFEDDGSPCQLTESISLDSEWAMIFANQTEAVFTRK